MIARAYFYVCFLICFFTLLKGITASDAHKQSNVNVEVYYFDNCPSESGFPMEFTNITMKMDIETKKIFISGRLEMRVPWTEKTGTHLILSKCLTRDDINSCNKYFETSFEDMCKHMPEKNKQWSDFVAAVEGFDPHCPLQEGSYTVTDAPISTDMLENMQMALGIWRMAFKANDGDTVTLCTNSAVEVKRARRGGRKKAG